MKINSIIIVGGGSSGWFTASALNKHCPEIDVTLIESPKVPTIGVGESTVDKMSSAQYEKNAESIMEAIRSGECIYDISGSAR